MYTKRREHIEQPACTERAGASARRLWFGSYPVRANFISCALALLCTCALSCDPTSPSYHAIKAIDPHATGALYMCYEVLLSFPGNEHAIMFLALACMLIVPIRYVCFGRHDRLRASTVFPALAFAACMVFGRSYDLTDSAALAVGGISRIIMSLISGAGFAVLAYVGICLLFEFFDGEVRGCTVFSESRFGRIWAACHALLDRHPVIVPCCALLVAWVPTFIASMPGLFMGDTGGQIRQWFNLPSGTSDYLSLIDPQVLLNGHHPVAHTALLGSCVQLGMGLFGNENAGVLIYTTLQYVLTALAVAYALAVLRKLGVGLLARSIVLGFFVAMPLFSNYAVLITKDVLFTDAFLLLVVQTAMCMRARCGRGDWLLLALGAIGCAFLRNGGIVFSVIACLVVAACRWRGGGTRRSGAFGALAVLAAACALYGMFSYVVMPVLKITPGSRREVLSIPFQQTARFVAKHDSAHAGIPGGTDDGLVSDEERAAIDAALDYETLASRYNPDKSDAVKNGFNEDATAEDMAAYVRAWAEMLLKDPGSYLSAFINNYYGYFYPSEKSVWIYDTASSVEMMHREENTLYFDFEPASGSLVDGCNAAVNLYRCAVQRIPLVSLTMNSASYVWLLVLLSAYLVRRRRMQGFSLLLPLWGVVAVCLIGPCNGATYMRYLYPVIVALPFAMALVLRPVPVGAIHR